MTKISNLKESILIYAAGESGSRFFLKLTELGLEKKVIGFLDSSPELQGKRCCDLEIFDTKKLLSNLNKTSIVIATTTPEFIKQIQSTLKTCGVNRRYFSTFGFL